MARPALIAALSCCFVLPLTADDGKSDLTAMSLEELMKIEIYTASKFLQRASEAPASVTVVTADEIARYGHRTLAEVLGSIPGFYFTNDRNYSYVGVRGFARPGDYNSRLLLLLDGHRLNDNIYDSVLAGQESPIDVDLIERIEVIRGPSSSLYGTSAFFGVVNIVTRKGGAFGGVQTAVEAASHGTYRGRVGYGTRFRNGIDLLWSASVLDSAGPSRLFFKEYDDPATNNGIAENADRESNRTFFASFSYGNWSALAGYGSRKKTIPTASFDTVFNTDRTAVVDARRFADVKYERTFASELGLMARLSWDGYDYRGDYLYDYSDVPGEPFYVLNRDAAVGSWWNAEAQLSRRLWTRHRFTTGAEFRNNYRQRQENFDVEPYLSYLNDRRGADVWAAYIQDECSIGKNLLLNVGLRHDHWASAGGTTNPRLGLVYGASKPTTLKLLYGRAFRAPNAFELFYEAETSRSNPHLRPEVIRTAELVVERSLGSRVRFSGSGYYYTIKNLITQRQDPSDGVAVFENAERVEARGVEMLLTARNYRGWQGQLSYTLQQATDSATREFLSNSPRHLAKLAFIAPLIGRKAFAGFESFYMGKRRTYWGETAGGYLLSNVTLSSTRLFRSFILSAGIYNLFDKRYGDPGAEEHRQQTIEQNGRTFRVKLQYRLTPDEN